MYLKPVTHTIVDVEDLIYNTQFLRDPHGKAALTDKFKRLKELKLNERSASTCRDTQRGELVHELVSKNKTSTRAPIYQFNKNIDWTPSHQKRRICTSLQQQKATQSHSGEKTTNQKFELEKSYTRQQTKEEDNKIAGSRARETNKNACIENYKLEADKYYIKME